MKLKLSTTVVFSAIIGFLLGMQAFSLSHFILLICGGFLVTGSANAFNQILEKDWDALMKRTAVRPLPQKKLNQFQAIIFAVIIGILGIEILHQINWQCSFFGLMSIFLYVFAYTPLKRISPISIFVGAIPGAIPIMLGWVAATNHFGLEPGILFATQFFWQFPHFIAIVWVQEEEYNKAGFNMMLGGKKGKLAASVSIFTSIVMLMLSVVPYFWSSQKLMLSDFGVIIVACLGIWFTLKSIRLFNHLNDTNAKQLMLSSFSYLPLMQLVYILDKFLIQ